MSAIKGVVIDGINIQRDIFGEIFSQCRFEFVKDFVGMMIGKPRDRYARKFLREKKAPQRVQEKDPFLIVDPKAAENQIDFVIALEHALKSLQQISQPVKAVSVFRLNRMQSDTNRSRQSKFYILVWKIRFGGEKPFNVFGFQREKFKEFFCGIILQESVKFSR